MVYPKAGAMVVNRDVKFSRNGALEKVPELAGL